MGEPAHSPPSDELKPVHASAEREDDESISCSERPASGSSEAVLGRQFELDQAEAAAALARLSSAAAKTLYDAIVVAETLDEFHRLARLVWLGAYEGAISHDAADWLQSLINGRRPSSRGNSPGHLTILARAGGLSAGGEPGSRFKSRQRPRSPDRKASRARRRTLGGSSSLPPKLRVRYTEGQRAVMCVVAGEVKQHGICRLPIDKIAALAGVCRTTVQTTMHEARRQGDIQIVERPRRGRKSLTNILKIASADWHAWLRRGPRRLPE
jgi:hypothetical protein